MILYVTDTSNGEQVMYQSGCCTSGLAVATHKGKLTARRLVITFVPTAGWKLEEWPQIERAVGRVARNTATPS
jgi:hypothetical protein